MRKGNYRFRRPRCCGSMMVSAYIRHGSSTPGIEKVGLYCPRCRRFEIERPMQQAFDEFVKKYPVLKHVASALKPYMDTVRGLYFHGSRARGDYRDDSDYDLLLISRNKIDEGLKTELAKCNIQIECFTLKQAKKQLDLEPSYLLTVLRQGIPLIGADVQKQLLRKKVNDIALHVEIESCGKQLKLLKKLLRDEIDGRDKCAVLYSAMIRLRRVHSIKQIYDNTIKPLLEDFRGYYRGDFERLFGLFREVRDLPVESMKETEIPEDFRKLNKKMLKGFVTAVDAYIRDAYDNLTEMLIEKLELDK